VLPLLLALAAEPSVAPVYMAVVPVVIAGDDYGFREEEVRRAIASIATRRLDVRALTVADLDAHGSDPVARLRDCGGDAACFGKVLRETTASLALTVVVNARVTPPVISVRAVAASGDVLAEAVGATRAEDRDLGSAVERSVSEVLDRLGYKRWARLVVHSSAPGAAVRVEEPAASHLESSNVALIPGGRTRLHVEAADHLPANLDLELEAGEDKEVWVTLEPSQTWWESPWFWGAVGIGIAGGATAAVLAATASGSCLCVGHPGAPCACP